MYDMLGYAILCLNVKYVGKLWNVCMYELLKLKRVLLCMLCSCMQLLCMYDMYARMI